MSHLSLFSLRFGPFEWTWLYLCPWLCRWRPGQDIQPCLLRLCSTYCSILNCLLSVNNPGAYLYLGPSHGLVVWWTTLVYACVAMPWRRLLLPSLLLFVLSSCEFLMKLVLLFIAFGWPLAAMCLHFCQRWSWLFLTWHSLDGFWARLFENALHWASFVIAELLCYLLVRMMLFSTLVAPWESTLACMDIVLHYNWLIAGGLDLTISLQLAPLWIG